MKRCIACNANFSHSSSNCPECGHTPEIIDGFYAYAPEYCHGGGGFKAHYFSKLAQTEANNFWFQSRNQLITWALRKYSPQLSSILEIGCGTGYVLSGIRKEFPDASLYGSEIFTTGLGFASDRLPHADFMQMDARNIPYTDEFDVIGAFDVLEHIKEDRQVLNQIYKALKIQGTLLITVPQHKWLWSAVDEYACHERRYSANDLYEKITSAGFQVMRSTSFVTTLLPVMVVSRYLQKKKVAEDTEASSELNIPDWMNYTFLRLLDLERAIIRSGINLPVGGSRLVVAKKVPIE